VPPGLRRAGHEGAELAQRLTLEATTYWFGPNDISWTTVAACTGTGNPEIVSFPPKRTVGQGGPDRSKHTTGVDRRVDLYTSSAPARPRQRRAPRRQFHHHDTAKLCRRWRRSHRSTGVRQQGRTETGLPAGHLPGHDHALMSAPCSPPRAMPCCGHGVQLAGLLNSKAIRCWSTPGTHPKMPPR